LLSKQGKGDSTTKKGNYFTNSMKKERGKNIEAQHAIDSEERGDSNAGKKKRWQGKVR